MKLVYRIRAPRANTGAATRTPLKITSPPKKLNLKHILTITELLRLQEAGLRINT